MGTATGMGFPPHSWLENKRFKVLGAGLRVWGCIPFKSPLKGDFPSLGYDNLEFKTP